MPGALVNKTPLAFATAPAVHVVAPIMGQNNWMVVLNWSLKDLQMNFLKIL